MTGDVQGAGGGINRTLAAMKEVAADTQVELRAEQETSQEAFAAAQQKTSPFGTKIKKRRKTKKAQKARIQKNMKSAGKKQRMLPLKQIRNKADQYQRRNPELKSNILALLRQQIKPGDTKEEILRKLEEFYHDVSNADEALEFLMETTEGELAQTVKEAKEEHTEKFGREIQAGRNIGDQARAASEKGLGTPSSMRDMYRDVIGNPRDSNTLFSELSQKYNFKELKPVVDFLLHSLGSDMKSKGPSIPRGELHRLLTETRSLQAILGVYKFFKGRMGLVKGLFAKAGLKMPKQMTFEELAKAFMTLVRERHPSSGKVKERAVRLGIEDWIRAKIIAFSQLRDAIREVARLKIYRSLQHRDEVYMAIIETLEDLEDELEELEEWEEEQEEEEEEQEEQQDRDIDSIEKAE